MSKIKIKNQKFFHYLFLPYRIFKWLCFWTGFTVILMTLALGISLVQIVRSFPDLKRMEYAQLKEQALKSVSKKIEDKGRLAMYRWTSIQDISRDLLYTIVMSEDSSFFDHEGIDYDAVLNSLAENIRRKKYEYGASTISQQVVKNLFLSNEKSIVRKIKEFVMTEQLERRFTKNQILEIYLNIAEFGPDIFGVKAAAEKYFKKTPAQMNAAEGAFIAVMLPSPRRNYYSIFQNHNLAPSKKRKIRRILSDMLANEFISQQQYKQYLRYHFFNQGSP